MLEKRGAFFLKISDSFTRGVPDAFVAVPMRIVALEFKVDRNKSDALDRSYKSLGLSGAQDHTVRAIRRLGGEAFVVTDTVKGDRLRVWVPQDNFDERNNDMYIELCAGDDMFIALMGF